MGTHDPRVNLARLRARNSLRGCNRSYLTPSLEAADVFRVARLADHHGVEVIDIDNLGRLNITLENASFSTLLAPWWKPGNPVVFSKDLGILGRITCITTVS